MSADGPTNRPHPTPQETTPVNPTNCPPADRPTDDNLELSLPFDPDPGPGNGPTAKRAHGAEANRDPWWWSNAFKAVEMKAKTGVVFQAYDLVDEFGLAEPDSPCRWGPLMGHAAKVGLIERVGSTRSKRPTVAGSLVSLWRGVRRVPEPRKAES